MSRIPRICLVFALSFVLLAAAVPSHARTLTKPQGSHPAVGSWVDAALAWVGDLFTGAPHGQTSYVSKTTTYTSSGTGTTMTPMTGSMIDPGGCTTGCTH